MDHGYAPTAIDVWMRVAFARLAVSGPARVPNAAGAPRHLSRHGLAEIRELAGRSENGQRGATIADSNAGRIIASVLETLQGHRVEL